MQAKDLQGVREKNFALLRRGIAPTNFKVRGVIHQLPGNFQSNEARTLGIFSFPILVFERATSVKKGLGGLNLSGNNKWAFLAYF